MARNDDEFEAFVAARFGQLRRVSFLVVRDWQYAEDIVQAALMNVYSAWPRLERQGSLEAYARRAVINASISWMRKPRRDVPSESVPDVAESAASISRAGRLDEDLVAALKQVTPAQAAIIALRYVDDMSVAEVADLLGISEGTVKSQSSRGLAKLKNLMQPVGPRSSHHD